MPWALRSVATAGSDSARSLTISTPAGTTKGDLLVAFVAGPSETFSLPSGWTSISSYVFSGRIATGTEAANYLWGTTPDFFHWAGGIACFSGFDYNSSLTAEGTSGNNGSSSPASFTGLTPHKIHELFVATINVGWFTNSSNTLSTPAGYTQTFDARSPDQQQAVKLMHAFDLPQSLQTPGTITIGNDVNEMGWSTGGTMFQKLVNKQSVL